MSRIISHTTFRAIPRVRRTVVVPRRAASDAAVMEDRQRTKKALREGARQDPELYVLFAIMSGIFGIAGWHFSRSPTSASAERPVTKIPGSEPWNTGDSSPYMYAPHGDYSAGRKPAPSVLNEVVIPDVTLPKELHDRFNKWGKPEY